MFVVKKTVRTEEGWTTAWSLTEEQMSYLLSFAINSLIAQGLVSVIEEDEDTTTEEKQNQLEFLESLMPEEMFKS